MKRLIASSLIVLGLASAAVSEELVREISWPVLDKAGHLARGEVLPDGSLRIVNPEPRAATFFVAVFKNPGVTALRYALVGKVRYEAVEAQSALELQSCFSNGESYFSRTLAQTGPMRSIEGTSDWRTFCLPFVSQEAIGTPERLELNLRFGGRGTVYLGPARLVQYAEGEDPLALASGSRSLSGVWWDDRTGNWFGAIGGSMLGCLGGLIGTLGGLGRGRRLVTSLVVALTLGGAVALLTGIVALALGQPYMVYYPLLLLGGISTVVCASLLPVIRRRYAEIELRKMTSLDVDAAGREKPPPSP